MAKQKGPWQVKSTKTIYKNPWMKITEDKVLRPDGKDGIFGVVQMKPGVTILAIDSKNNVYLTEGYHYAVGRISLEAISGGIDKDETKLDAAKRELKEESGLVAGKWTYLGVIDPFTTVVTSPNHLYLAQDLGKRSKNLDKTEKINVVRVNFGKAYDLVIESKITHGASVAVILKAKDYLK